MVLLKLLLCMNAASLALAASWIVPGTAWTDTDGVKIDAHGGMVFKRGSTFYWVGSAYASNTRPRMYSSTDLLNWKNLGLMASTEWYYRAKYAKPNGAFWIYGQVDRLVQPLRSTVVDSGYTAYGSGVSLPPNSYTYSDTGMFYDEDTTTYYLLTSADHNIVQINQINSDGSIGNRVNQLAAGAYEAPGMFKAGGKYFLIVSGKTGYRSNPNKMFYATSLTGSWNGPYDIAPQDQNTYNSQNTYELVLEGSQATTYIYMGDAWDTAGTPAANYTWLPMTVNTNSPSVTLQYYAQWKVDPNTGVVSTPSSKKRWQATDAVLLGRAAVAECESCIHKRFVHEISSENEVLFTNVTGSGKPQWISFHYTVERPDCGDAYIYVNDEAKPRKLSDLNAQAGYHSNIPVELTLAPGDVNSIRFGAHGSEDLGLKLDGIEIFEEDFDL